MDSNILKLACNIAYLETCLVATFHCTYADALYGEDCTVPLLKFC